MVKSSRLQFPPECCYAITIKILDFYGKCIKGISSLGTYLNFKFLRSPWENPYSLSLRGRKRDAPFLFLGLSDVNLLLRVFDNSTASWRLSNCFRVSLEFPTRFFNVDDYILCLLAVSRFDRK